jgi:FkbM family methyltransferase
MRSPFSEGLHRGDYVKVRDAQRFRHGTTRFYDRPLRYSDSCGFLHSVREIFADQVYLFKAKNETPRIIDAGANIGLSVIYFKRLYPDCSILAFEPDPQIYELLSQNVGAMSGVELRQEAAWIEDTVLTFYSEGSLAGSSEVDFLGEKNKMEVKASRLRNELDKGHVDFLKIDIEGAENSVLFDIEDRLDRVDYLFFEYHSVPDKPQRLGDMLSLASRAGFRYVINGTHGVRLPFVERASTGFDLQANVFCFRE